MGRPRYSPGSLSTPRLEMAGRRQQEGRPRQLAISHRQGTNDSVPPCSYVPTIARDERDGVPWLGRATLGSCDWALPIQVPDVAATGDHRREMRDELAPP